jgi:hypothetical protein
MQVCHVSREWARQGMPEDTIPLGPPHANTRNRRTVLKPQVGPMGHAHDYPI